MNYQNFAKVLNKLSNRIKYSQDYTGEVGKRRNRDNN